ncbi:ARM repeat-containing protein [Microthyrium microscopicum]|uniref:Importin-95 n=1 Tax=Microthyrium microscopicum TaxID=703497 RepID=A0A6A6UKB8_9PEZI|nr:ARM repeat-containing protein [Microthyrium microscopicum]
MNVNSVLEATLSPDARTRGDAEEQLKQAQQTDFAGYLTTLAAELANEQAASSVRYAAALALKNSFTYKDFGRLREVQSQWLTSVTPEARAQIKDLSIKTLASTDSRAGQGAAQFIASIAAIELPRDQWPELMTYLVDGVAKGDSKLKQAALNTIGFICETNDAEFRETLSKHSNAILTAVVQGARKEEPNENVRNAAITALSDSLEFVRSNFENEGERNYIMQVICEATQAGDSRIQQGAWGCLNRIMGLYYEKMKFYVEKALFGLTIQGMKSEDEDVGKLAVEFWCTICDQEMEIEDENTQASAEGSAELREYFSFAKIATPEVIPVILELLTRQDEDAADDEYNISRAAYQCLQLWASCVGTPIMTPVLSFVEKHLRSEDWHFRDAAVSAFGGIVDGPEPNVLTPIIQTALPVLIGMMNDPVVHVMDSVAYALGRICEFNHHSIEPAQHLQPLIASLFTGLAAQPKIAASCCWALMNLADQFAGEPGCQSNPLTAHFQASVTHLLAVTDRQDADNQLRTAAYEVLNSFVTNSAIDSLRVVAELSNVILERLEKTIPLQAQVVSIEDKMTLEEMQVSLTSVVVAIIQRLEVEIKPQSDRIMTVLLQLLNNVPPKSAVPDTVFAAVGALANSLEADFLPYMETFAPYLYKGLENTEEISLCSMSIGLVSDIVRSLGDKVQPWCDELMNRLLTTLQSNVLSHNFKPAILQSFGDIAQAIGPAFETYLNVVSTILRQAGQVVAGPNDPFELHDYVTSLREGIMDAWDGIIIAMMAGDKTALLVPHLEAIFQLIHAIFQEHTRSEALLRSCMGVVGDVSRAFPNGDYAELFRAEWLTAMAREIRANRDFRDQTIEVARWARDQIKRQSGETSFHLSNGYDHHHQNMSNQSALPVW